MSEEGCCLSSEEAKEQEREDFKDVWRGKREMKEAGRRTVALNDWAAGVVEGGESSIEVENVVDV